MRPSDALVVGLWAATVFGLAEGAILVASRPFSAVLAPYKVSVHGLWVAPLVDLALALPATAVLLAVVRWGGRWLGGRRLSVLHGAFAFLGAVTVVTAPAVIHPVAATLLSLGLAVAFCRGLTGSERRLTAALRSRLPWIPALLLAAGVGAWAWELGAEAWRSRQLPPAPTRAPNVLVIVLDTVRRDSVGHPGNRSLTPNLDRLAAGGVRFENAWATSSWSLASQASIVTGRYAHEHGADWPEFSLDPRYPTLAEFFAGRGYATGAFSGNAAWATPEYLGRGFLRFDAYLPEDLVRRTVHGRKLNRLLGEVGYHAAGRGKKAPQLNREFLRFLDRYPGRPFFAYLCYMDVNQAFHDRRLNPGFRRRASRQEVVRAYEEGLRRLDGDIGRLLDDLDRRGVLGDTLLVLTSDHGESFGADDGGDHDPAGHGTSLYAEQARVILSLVYPGKLPAGRAVPRAVSTRAIAPTIAHLLGVTDSPFVGDPLVTRGAPELPGEDAAGAVLVTLNYGKRRLQSLIWGRWQYIRDLREPSKGEELYDLLSDPSATLNLGPAHPALARMREGLEELLARGSEARPPGRGPFASP